MYLTEEEAKAKWCPFARTVERHSDGVTAARNRVAIVEGDTASIASDALIGVKCIGSACMAWRWLTVAEVTGWCGLAARPDEAEQAKSDIIEERLDDEIQF